jgi:hypothetical protein
VWYREEGAGRCRKKLDARPELIFYLRLALRLGRSLRELLATVSSEELTLWKAFDTREPIGDTRMDFGFGVVASTVANVNRKPHSETFKPSDFMPLLPKPAVPLAQKVRMGLMNLGGGKRRKE